MRKDMAKVIVERPRRLDSAARRGRAVAHDVKPKIIGLRRGVQEVGGFKMLNENLAPLRRYLDRQVGRPWNKVYSEIAAGLKVTSTVQQHVRDHISDFVQLHPSEQVRQYRWSQRPWFQPLYVDPADGLLKRTERHPWVKALAARTKPVPAVDRIRLGEGLELRRIAGLWFEVRLAPLPRAAYRPVVRPDPLIVSAPGKSVLRTKVVRQLVTPAVHDVVSGEAVLAGPEIDEPLAWRVFREKQPELTYAISKRQLSRRELKRHSLVNAD
jgi:hypothetical protein